jgi:diketogulonate reductase-like aldo/keto reductase
MKRRELLKLISFLVLGFPGKLAAQASRASIRKEISRNKSICPIGMGTWITFDVSSNNEIEVRKQILKAFFAAGGELIDSSPMYGNAEKVLGLSLTEQQRQQLFAATKVWTLGKNRGVRQMQRSEQLWGIERFDLMQIHNMLDWQVHYETLQQWKAEGRISHVGITTSHGRRHEKLEQVLLNYDFDFVQFTYNMEDREVEQRLLPLAQEKNIHVIINRPFQGGRLFNLVKGSELPAWASEIDCQNWAQYFLKFIISHPAVTCAIPATSKLEHMHENMGAALGRLPDQAMRRRMLQYYQSL